jgi:hypothetical protein
MGIYGLERIARRFPNMMSLEGCKKAVVRR